MFVFIISNFIEKSEIKWYEKSENNRKKTSMKIYKKKQKRKKKENKKDKRIEKWF